MKLQREESENTDLKKRSSRIFNVQLKTVDPSLHLHLVKQGIQPELVLIKWLKCLLSREFNL